MRSVGFDPVASAHARALILGTLPGANSLKANEYYAHQPNSFWWIMGQLVGASPDLAYKNRLQRLKESGIALWDVCRSAERDGSSDAKILLETIELNNFDAFLLAYPQIEIICFNGKKAEQFFQRLVLPLSGNIRPIQQRALPSTSPANAGITREEKLAQWRICLSPFIHLKKA